MKKILVTGGCGFIGSNYIHQVFEKGRDIHLVNLDKMTYAGNIHNLNGIPDTFHTFVEGDICDADLVKSLFEKYQFDAVVHFAAESHVDRSIEGPAEFIQTNVVGTLNLLEQSRLFYQHSNSDNFRFLHISTDEVYGDIKIGKRSDEKFSYNPSSPYSASKASADHLIKSFARTYKLPAIISNCCNNYGPNQFPEKLIPKLIYNIIKNKPLPIYGRGKNSREWIHVQDHCQALLKIFLKGKIGESYNVGSNKNNQNIDIAKKLITILKSNSIIIGNKVKIKFVKDRPGHDFRYALDCKKIHKELKWKSKINLNEGLADTYRWYLNNMDFFISVSKKLYDKRLGLNKK